MADYDLGSKSGGDSELQEFLMAEKQKAEVHAQVCKFHNLKLIM